MPEEQVNYAEPFIVNDVAYKDFKKAYCIASNANMESFNFGGQSVLTKFAYYLLVYVEMERQRLGNMIVGQRVEVLK